MNAKPATAYIAYFRVSTARQGESGLGLDAQRATVEAFVRQHGGEIVGQHVEVESGRRSDRPELAKALAAAKRAKATLLIAKLDRLARNVLVVATLMESDVDFVACDQPYANRLTLHILAAVAEDEARRISERTKAALAAAKARGQQLGSPVARETIAAARAKWSARAAAKTTGPKQVVADLRAAGITTLSAIAAALTERGIRTARGGTKWHAAQVSRLLEA